MRTRVSRKYVRANGQVANRPGVRRGAAAARPGLGADEELFFVHSVDVSGRRGLRPFFQT
jgi:hypothetical protein